RAPVCAVERDEARAEAVETTVVLVARRLIDAALAAELRLVRHHREAVRLHIAVPAAFTDEIVDHDAPRPRGREPSLALTVQLGGARLIVDQRRNAALLPELALHAVELGPIVHAHAGREPVVALRIAARVVRDDRDRLDALGRELLRDLRDRQLALDGLAAGHRDRVVEQDLVRDVHARRDRRTYREAPGVGVGAVTEILEDMARVGERREPDPRRALAAHLRER